MINVLCDLVYVFVSIFLKSQIQCWIQSSPCPSFLVMIAVWSASEGKYPDDSHQQMAADLS